MFDNNNRGVMFPNDKKKPDNNHPDMKGSLNAAGVDYWLSGWIKVKDGQKYMQVSIQPKEVKVDEHTEAKGNGFVGDALEF